MYVEFRLALEFYFDFLPSNNSKLTRGAPRILSTRRGEGENPIIFPHVVCSLTLYVLIFTFLNDDVFLIFTF